MRSSWMRVALNPNQVPSKRIEGDLRHRDPGCVTTGQGPEGCCHKPRNRESQELGEAPGGAQPCPRLGLRTERINFCCLQPCVWLFVTRGPRTGTERT